MCAYVCVALRTHAHGSRHTSRDHTHAHASVCCGDADYHVYRVPSNTARSMSISSQDDSLLLPVEENDFAFVKLGDFSELELLDPNPMLLILGDSVAHGWSWQCETESRFPD